MTSPPEPAFDLVIFDCDGVLVDSEPIANAVLAEMLREIGLPITLEQTIATFVGRSLASCLQIIERRLGHPPPHGFADALRSRTYAALSSELEPVRGVRDVLRTLRIPHCVASSGEHAKMRLTLQRTGLLQHFEGRLFSVTEVARGKPFPDIYLRAADRMSAVPERTAVIEDTEIGVRGAMAAGMTAFGYAERSDPERLAAAGALVFDRMSELPALLARRARDPAMGGPRG